MTASEEQISKIKKLTAKPAVVQGFGPPNQKHLVPYLHGKQKQLLFRDSMEKILENRIRII